MFTHTQESFDSDDEDTAVSFNHPTVQKLGLQAHTAQSTAAACAMAQVEKPILQSFSLKKASCFFRGCFSVKTWVDRAGAGKIRSISSEVFAAKDGTGAGGPLPKNISFTHW